MLWNLEIPYWTFGGFLDEDAKFQLAESKVEARFITYLLSAMPFRQHNATHPMKEDVKKKTPHRLLGKA